MITTTERVLMFHALDCLINCIYMLLYAAATLLPTFSCNTPVGLHHDTVSSYWCRRSSQRRNIIMRQPSEESSALSSLVVFAVADAAEARAIVHLGGAPAAVGRVGFALVLAAVLCVFIVAGLGFGLGPELFADLVCKGADGGCAGDHDTNVCFDCRPVTNGQVVHGWVFRVCKLDEVLQAEDTNNTHVEHRQLLHGVQVQTFPRMLAIPLQPSHVDGPTLKGSDQDEDDDIPVSCVYVWLIIRERTLRILARANTKLTGICAERQWNNEDLRFVSIGPRRIRKRSITIARDIGQNSHTSHNQSRISSNCLLVTACYGNQQDL
ncbi:hypothetical protein KCU98_g2, partial [Aureobasidium melanogenum]